MYCRALIQHGASIDVQDVEGKTALFIAVYESKYKTIELLLKYGTDIEICDKNKLTALMIAIKNHDFESMELYKNKTL